MAEEHTTNVDMTATGVVYVDGQLYQLELTGEAEITRGPLGRIIDCCAQIEADGLQVPPLISAALEELQKPQLLPVVEAMGQQLATIRDYAAACEREGAPVDPMAILKILNGERPQAPTPWIFDIPAPGE